MMPPGLHSAPELPEASVLRIHNKAFKFTLQKHLDLLGVKPKLTWFQVSDPQEIVDFIRGQQNTYRKTSTLHRSMDYWNSKIIEPLRQFFTAVDQGVPPIQKLGE